MVRNLVRTLLVLSLPLIKSVVPKVRENQQRLISISLSHNHDAVWRHGELGRQRVLLHHGPGSAAAYVSVDLQRQHRRSVDGAF